MSLYNNIQLKFSGIPKPIKQFALKALLMFITWQVLYTYILLPSRIIDKPLSNFTGQITASILRLGTNENVFVKEIQQQETIEGVTLSYKKATLYRGDKRLIGIGDGCNGLSLYVLFLGFIIAYPGNLKSKVLFGIGGLILIIIVNILRVTGLVILIEKYPNLAQFAHHYAYKIITYALVFILWVQFTKFQQKKISTHA